MTQPTSSDREMANSGRGRRQRVEGQRFSAVVGAERTAGRGEGEFRHPHGHREPRAQRPSFGPRR